jgi:hypothetical protein
MLVRAIINTAVVPIVGLQNLILLNKGEHYEQSHWYRSGYHKFMRSRY